MMRHRSPIATVSDSCSWDVRTGRASGEVATDIRRAFHNSGILSANIALRHRTDFVMDSLTSRLPCCSKLLLPAWHLLPSSSCVVEDVITGMLGCGAMG